MYNTNNSIEVGVSDNNIWKTLDIYLGDKSYFLNLYKRTHRLSSAIFLVSNNIEEGDVVKSHIKDACVKMLSLTISLKDAASYPEIQKTLLGVEGLSLNIVSLFDIAVVSGSISVMNAGIIKNEFNNLIKELNQFKQSSDEVEKGLVSDVFSGGITDKELPVFSRSNQNVVQKNLPIKDNIPQRQEDNENKRHNRKTLRKNLVYEFILKHKGSSIKDIVPNIKGCSEKTIQREIMELIKDGKVSKVGERRWSKYSVI